MSFPQRDKEGHVPSSSRCCCSTMGRAPALPVMFSFPFGWYAPPCRVVAISPWQAGHRPFPLCSPFIFDAMRRGMALLVVLLPFQHDEEGRRPPHRVLVSFFMWRGGACPSSSRCCHFNTTGWAPALPVVFSFHFWRNEEGKPLLMLLLISTQQGGYCPPCCVLWFL